MAVTRLVAPGPLVPMHTPALPVARRVAFRRETAALLVARQNGADFGFRERLVDFHARAAGIGKNDLDAFAFEGFDEDVAPEHGRADLGALGGLLFLSRRSCFAGGRCGGFSCLAHRFCD